MMRSLWTGASGMIAQQTNVDNIAHNLANINTTGFKKANMEFKSLLYQTMQADSTDSEGNPKPIGIQVGLGVRNSATTTQFTQGAVSETGNQWDFAIRGAGFFVIQLEDGTQGYTRSGALQMSIGTDGLTLSTLAGQPVLDTNGEPIVVPEDYIVSRLTVDSAGNLCYPNETGNAESIGVQIGLVQFNNPAGLDKANGSTYKATATSGEPRWEHLDDKLGKSSLLQTYLEASNVQAAEEMVNLIVAQRAYEMNSKIITASDTMLQQANNLRS